MNLAEVIKQWRWAIRIDTRTAARIIGISPATLRRFERGQNCDARTLSKVLKWLLAEASAPTERRRDISTQMLIEKTAAVAVESKA